MTIEATHQDYNHYSAAWRVMRDVLKGANWIKGRGEAYLPRPSGMKPVSNSIDPYSSYLKRSRFPDIVSPTLRGLLGCLQRKDHLFTLPDRMHYLLTAATADGLKLSDLVTRIASEILITGRCPILVDAPQTGGPPYLTPFVAEQLTNWRCQTQDGRELLDLAVLRTTEEWPRDSDKYSNVSIVAYRGLTIDADGVYQQELYQQKESGPIEYIDTFYPTGELGPIDEIPLVIIGSTDIDASVDILPLYGIAEIALSIYQQYADYRQALFMTSQPTAVISGIDPDSAPPTIGASTLWTLPPSDARAYFLEFSGAGIAAQRVALQDEFDEASAIGAQMLESKKAVESAEALRLRQGAVTATLLSVADAIESGLTKALNYIADWLQITNAGIEIKINKDFTESGIDPMTLSALVAGWQARAYSREVLWANLRNREVIPTTINDEELLGQLETEAPILPTTTYPFTNG